MKWTLVILLSSLLTANGLHHQGCSVSTEEGETVVLPVKDSKLSNPTITWKTETKKVVHQCRNKQDYNGSQDKRFKGRTSLFNEEVKKGNFSLKIINVTKDDAGKYICEVLHKDPDIDKTYNVSLCVMEKGWRGDPTESKKTKEPGQTPEESTKPEQKPVLTPVTVLIAIGVLIALAAPAAFFLYKRCKKESKRKDQGARGDDQEMDPLTGEDP